MDSSTALRSPFVFADLLLWTKFGEPSMALEHAGFGFWWLSLVRYFCRISRVSSFLQYVHGNLWISWSGDDSSRLVVRDRIRVFGRGQDQCRDRPGIHAIQCRKRRRYWEGIGRVQTVRFELGFGLG